MSKIENLILTDRNGNQYSVMPMQDAGYAVKATWICDGASHSLEIEPGTDQSLRAFLTPDQDFLLVFWGKSTQYPSPRNLVVLNPDGSLRHYPELPRGISPEYQIREERIGAERARNTLIFLDAVHANNQVAIWVGFARDFYESRVFDPETGVFGVCLEVGRA